MTDQSALGPWVRRFLLEYLPGERNFTRNTQESYRDALRLLIVFAAGSLHKKPDQLLVEEIGADLLRKFMRHIEEVQRFYEESATGGNPCASVFHRGAVPRTPRLVRRDPCHRVQAYPPRSRRLHGKERNRRLA